MLFPLRIATVLKSTVPFILSAGTWMQTAVDDESQCIVLVPKRLAAHGMTRVSVTVYHSSATQRMAAHGMVAHDFDVGMSEALSLPVVVPAPPLASAQRPAIDRQLTRLSV